MKRSTRWICLILAGAGLNVALLLLPAMLCQPFGQLLLDPVVALFLVLATCFFAADASTVLRPDEADGRRESSACTTTAVCAQLMGLAILAVFWTGLVERSLVIGRGATWWQLAGGSLMLAGVVLRHWAVRALGSYFVTEIKVRPDQPLVQSGVYRWLRHPSETGNLAIVVGASVLLGSVIGLAICGASVLPLVLWRVRREDRLLDATFGERHRRYAEQVKSLIPLLY